MKNNLINFNWRCKTSWRISAKNTFLCLLGCAIGDNATILFFQKLAPDVTMWAVMVIAMIGGITSSITLETFILLKQLNFRRAVQVAFGMSFISMLMMEASANIASILFAGGNRLMLTWWSIVPSWIIGFLFAWVYNYYNIKKHGRACHG